MYTGPVGSQNAPIDPAAYTEEYFRTSVEGFAEFEASGGRSLTPRMKRALDLADVRPGQRILDIACGRGEIVLNGALRGAFAVGIDYAAGALNVARESLSRDQGPGLQAGLSRMDATRLAFREETFDAAFMLDFVEHVYQPDLEAALREVARALRPGGRLVIHTSPNRVFEEVVYPRYVRNVHRAVLGAAKAARVRNRFFNEMILPTDPVPPHNEYERELHINPQSARSLRDALERSGLQVRRLDHWEPPAGSFFPPEERWLNIGLGALDAVRFLRPVSRYAPLSKYFSNHVWVVAERPG
jgi:ubiquinone/menaquinone biosynthesis C-methylase UbiE